MGASTPSPVELIVRGWIMGAAIGAGLALLLILTNAAGLADLIAQSTDGLVAAVLLVFGFATLIAALYSGAAVMLIPQKDD